MPPFRSVLSSETRPESTRTSVTERRRFTQEFKLEAVRLIRDRAVSCAQASEDLKVHSTQLRLWSTIGATRGSEYL